METSKGVCAMIYLHRACAVFLPLPAILTLVVLCFC